MTNTPPPGYFDEHFSVEEAEIKLALAAGAERRLQWLEEAFEFAILAGAIKQQRWQETLGAIDNVLHNKVVAEDEVHAWLKSWDTAHEHKPPATSN